MILVIGIVLFVLLSIPAVALYRWQYRRFIEGLWSDFERWERDGSIQWRRLWFENEDGSMKHPVKSTRWRWEYTPKSRR